jgi:hypothetical protein
MLYVVNDVVEIDFRSKLLKGSKLCWNFATYLKIWAGQDNESERNGSWELKMDLYEYYRSHISICVHESVTRLAIGGRFVKDTQVSDEVIKLTTCSGTSTGRDRPHYNVSMNTFSASQLDISEIVPLTTDSSPSMSGREAGFVTLFTKHVSHSIVHFRCIVHQEALWASHGR